MRKLTLSVTVAVLCLTFFIATAYAVGDGYKPVVQTSDMKTAYIHHIEQRDGKILLTVDDINWYEGAEADKVFLEREPDSGLDGTPDGYYIVNDEEKFYTIEVAPDAQVLMQIYDKTGNLEDIDTNWNEQITVAQLEAIFNNNELLDVSEYPFHLTIQDGKVVKVVQQYLP